MLSSRPVDHAAGADPSRAAAHPSRWTLAPLGCLTAGSARRATSRRQVSRPGSPHTSFPRSLRPFNPSDVRASRACCVLDADTEISCQSICMIALLTHTIRGTFEVLYSFLAALQKRHSAAAYPEQTCSLLGYLGKELGDGGILPPGPSCLLWMAETAFAGIPSPVLVGASCCVIRGRASAVHGVAKSFLSPAGAPSLLPTALRSDPLDANCT
jgi:hypothetical protein